MPIKKSLGVSIEVIKISWLDFHLKKKKRYSLDINVNGRRPHRRIRMHATIVKINRRTPMKIVSVFESHSEPDILNTSTA